MDTSTTSNGHDATRRLDLGAMSRAFEQIVGRATEPLGGWSRQMLAQLERGAAKGLWSASVRLDRAATRLDAAGLSLATRKAANGGAEADPSADPLGDESFPPHLA